MNSVKHTSSGKQGFSLIEVILAIAVFGLTIVAVIGLLGPAAQQVRDLQDLKVANSLPGPIREELNRVGFLYFVNDTLTDTQNLDPPLYMYAPEDGSRVVAYTDRNGVTVADPPDAGNGYIPPDGIPQNRRYFEIRVEDPENPLDGAAANDELWYTEGSAYVALKITISWPNNLPTGQNPSDFSTVDEQDRTTFEYYTAVVAGEPF